MMEATFGSDSFAQELCYGDVDLRWPIPVICRDVNYLHQAETRLMYPADIVPFLQDELFGLDWSQDRVEEALGKI